MHVLAIDTSLPTGSVAAIMRSAGGVNLLERPLGASTEHARRLMPELVAAAASQGWKISDVTLVAVVRGPGSFTGLRVGVTTAKSLCWATGAALVGVSGFAVVARQTAVADNLREEVAIAFDAGRGDVYAALAIPDDTAATGWSVTAGELLAADRWLDSLPVGRRVSGPALEMHAAAAAARGLALAARSAWCPSAGQAATVAMLCAETNTFDDPHTLLPEYSRPSYAEEKNPAPSG